MDIFCWTMMRVAVPFLNATYMEIGLLAIFVLAEYIVCIMPMLEARRALVTITLSFRCATLQSVIVAASRCSTR